MQKALGKLGLNSTTQDFAEARLGAADKVVDARSHALLKHGFGGNITGLFEKIEAAEADSEQKVDPDELQVLIEAFQRVPEADLKRAKVIVGIGYYIGGRLVSD